MTGSVNQGVHGRETPERVIAALIATLQEQVLPQLAAAPARAAAASMLQVLEQMARTVAWAPEPLRERLRVRKVALAQLAEHFGLQRSGEPTLADIAPTDALALERGIEACDAYVASLVPLAPAAPWERWLVGYCRVAADVDQRFMAPSHLGKLTRKASAGEMQETP